MVLLCDDCSGEFRNRQTVSVKIASVIVQMSAAGGLRYYGVNRTDGVYGTLFGWDTTWGTTVRSVNSADNLALVVNSTTQAMTINPSGYVGIGATSPLGPLHIKKDSFNPQLITESNTTSEYRQLLGTTPYTTLFTNSSAGALRTIQNISLFFGTNDTNRMQITSTGSILFLSAPYTTNGTVVTVGGIGALNISSDERVKNSIRYFDSTGYSYYSGSSGPTAYMSFTGYNSLQRVLSLRPAQFKRNGYMDEYEGFIAQQVEQHLPLAVDGKKYDYEVKRDKEGNIVKDEHGQPILNYDIPRYRGLSDAAILAHTVKALQELTDYQTKQIDRLTDRVTSLETSLEAALIRITALENNP